MQRFALAYTPTRPHAPRPCLPHLRCVLHVPGAVGLRRHLQPRLDLLAKGAHGQEAQPGQTAGQPVRGRGACQLWVTVQGCERGVGQGQREPMATQSGRPLACGRDDLAAVLVQGGACGGWAAAGGPPWAA